METLLTVERKQKLDLLLHLLANIQDILVVRGEEGVGKTTLLTAAVKRKIPSCDILLLNAELSLSFESIQYELLQFINEKYQLDSRSIADVLLTYAKQDEKLVLIIDDAGLLITGLINALVNYSKEYPALKLVLSVTPQDWLLKEKTENLKENCHFIDLLNLDFQRSSEHEQQLIASGSMPYAEAKGGLLVDISQDNGNLGGVSRYINSTGNKPLGSRGILFLLVSSVAITSGAISTYLWRDSNVGKNKTEEVKSLREHEKEEIVVVINKPQVKIPKQIMLPAVMEVRLPIVKQPVTPQVDVPKVGMPQPPTVIKASEQAKVNAPKALKKIAPMKAAKGKNEIEQPIAVSVDTMALSKEITAQLEENKVEVIAQQAEVIEKKDDSLWVLEQINNKYTLQLMAISAKKALLKEKNQLNMQGYSTFYLIKTANAKQVCLLFYGVFDTLDEAKKEMQKLPPKYKNSWVRKFAALKKGLSN